MQSTFYWHDYETWGANPHLDRPAQFAGLRTDDQFTPVGRPLKLYAQPTPDFLPNPEAVLVTGITPQLALNQGVNEASFSQAIEHEFSQPGTTVIGYNNIRFDDEVTRTLFYRNFYDPYEYSWQNGNSRWDLIDVTRACFALRPEGIEWPTRDDGRVSLRLEHLTAANQIDHGQAHDAMSDVHATIGLARLIAEKQPKLWQWAYKIRRKAALLDLFNWQQLQPLVHVSGFYGSQQRYLSVILPIAFHPRQNNAVISWDLRHDPQLIADLSIEQITEALYANKQQRQRQQLAQLGLQIINLSRCPFLAPLKTLSGPAIQAAQLDMDTIAQRADLLLNQPDWRDKLVAVYEQQSTFSGTGDVDQQLYQGFFSQQDRNNMAMIRACSPEQLAGLQLNTEDKRLPELLFRYRARNFPATLSDQELMRWRQFCQQRLLEPPAGMLSAEDFMLRLQQLAETQQQSSHKMRLLKSLYDYAASL
ncbi:exodeoxyribonuclease I [Idiomarina seosinensis]|uniref:exodeoxyribonuclease I n=1 Tax=Idiomarina seosinensis TaxID=281739 RepID=UPI003850002C